MKTLADSSFPGLPTALNSEDMLDLLRSALKEDHGNLEVKEAKIVDVKYEPRKEAILLYRFKIKDRLTKISHRQLFTAMLLKEGENSPPPVGWENLMRFPAQEKLLIRKPFFYLEDPKILLCAFPYDPLMLWLGDTLDESFMAERLNLIWSHRNVVVQEVKTELLSYTPRLRAVFLYRIHLEDKKTGNRCWKNLIGKTSSYKIPEILFADLWSLWKTCGRKVGIPRPEGYLSDPPLLLQERVPGERLGDLLSLPSFQGSLLQTARSIADIHRARIPLNKMRDPLRETQSLRRWSIVLQNIRTDLARRIQTLQESLLKEMELRTAVTGTVHGDFHPTNVLVDGEKVYLIDFDQMAYGDPAADIGRFLASFRISSLRKFGDLYSLQGASETFLQEYLSAGSGDVSQIRMFESSSLITTAASAFRVQRQGWEKEVLLLLEEAERVFETAKSPTKASPRPNKEPSLKFDEKMKSLLDPTYMHAALGLYLRRNYEAEIFSCHILKSVQTESSCRITYRVEGRKTEEPWNCEVEGLLLKRPRKRALFNQLLSLQEVSDQTENAFIIPRPVAYLSPIGTIVQMPLSGIPFSSLLGNSNVPVLAARLARAISIVHRTKVPCDETRSTHEVCEMLEREILELIVHHTNFFHTASTILTEVKERISRCTQENAATLGDLTPDHVLLLENRLGISQVQKIVMSHPCLDMGEFLAHIKLLGMERNQQEEAEKMAEELRSAYCNLEGEESDLLAEFETIAALHLACSRVKNNAPDSIAAKLLAYAAEMLR